MNQLITLYEDINIKKLESQFFEDFRIELAKNGYELDYYKNWSDNKPYEDKQKYLLDRHMIVKKEFIEPLVHVCIRYMEKVLGFKLENIKINSFIKAEDLPEEEADYLMIHKFMGSEVKGFYDRKTKVICVKIGIHLIKVLNVIFHELTHAYMHQQNLKLEDSWSQPKQMCFSFENRMDETDQEEGFCELIATIMYYHIFNMKQYPSLVEEYWMGWRLCVQAYIFFLDHIRKMDNKEIKDEFGLVKITIGSMIIIMKQQNNFYKFVPKVPPNAFQERQLQFY